MTRDDFKASADVQDNAAKESVTSAGVSAIAQKPMGPQPMGPRPPAPRPPMPRGFVQAFMPPVATSIRVLPATPPKLVVVATKDDQNEE